MMDSAANGGPPAPPRPSLALSLARGLGVRLAFFTFFAAGVFILPFLPMILQQMGLSAPMIGLLGALRPAANALGAPLAGALADLLSAPRRVLLTALALSVPARMAFAVCPPHAALLVALTLFSEFSGSASGPLLDCLALRAVPSKEDYASVRLFGSIGFGLVAPLAGWAVQRGGVAAAAAGHGLLGLCTIVAVASLQRSPKIAPQAKPVGPAVVVVVPLRLRLAGFASVLLAPRGTSRAVAAAFWWLVFVSGAGLGVVGSFSPLLFEKLGGGAASFGVGLLLNCIGEVFSFIAAGRILQANAAASWTLLYLGAGGGALRCLYYALLPHFKHAAKPGLLGLTRMLLSEPLNGPQFALFWSGGMAASQAIVDPALVGAATVVGLYQGIFLVGLGAGSLIGGILYGRLGPTGLFTTTALALVLAGFGLYVARAQEGGSAGGTVTRAGAGPGRLYVRLGVTDGDDHHGRALIAGLATAPLNDGANLTIGDAGLPYGNEDGQNSDSDVADPASEPGATPGDCKLDVFAAAGDRDRASPGSREGDGGGEVISAAKFQVPAAASADMRERLGLPVSRAGEAPDPRPGSGPEPMGPGGPGASDAYANRDAQREAADRGPGAGTPLLVRSRSTDVGRMRT